MYTHKSLKLAILALFITTLVIFSGCDGTNHPPTIVSLTANPQSPIEVNQSTFIECLATDQDGDTLYYTWTGTGGMITGGGSIITWTAPAIAGTYTITCTVSDGKSIGIQSIIIEVLEPEPENQPPVITSIPLTTATVGETYIYDVDATDPDGDTLTYSLTTKPAGMTISSSTGIITWTPTAAGSFAVAVKVSDAELDDVQSFTITVPEPEIVYRAFLVGIGDYQYFPDAHGNVDLNSPSFNVDMMHDTLSHSGSGFYLINKLIDLQATKEAILNGIANAFSGAGVNDVSYFYFNGHGMYIDGVSYVCPTEGAYDSPLSSFISTNDLESALSAIPGTKVVFLDTCHSGGFIGKGKGEITISKEELESFNDEIINVFSQAEFKGLLTTNQYKVLTSCLSSQTCVELIPYEGDPWGLFTAVLCEGCGYDSYTHPYPADENENGEITLHEAYTCTEEVVTDYATAYNDYHGEDLINQDTQVYPLYSNFIIIEE